MKILIAILVILLSVGLPAYFLIPMVLGALSARRVQRTGKRAPGVITAIRQTGMSVNDQPQVEFAVRVEPLGEPTFETKIKRIVSLLEIPSIQPGTRVEVAYDPADHSKAAFAPEAATAPSVPEREQSQEHALLVDQLKAADLRVKVLPSGGAPFDSVVHGVFKPEGLPKYQAGKEIPVKYDPAEASAVSVDYSKASVENVD